MQYQPPSQIIKKLHKRLTSPLPGWDAHSLMASDVHRKIRSSPLADARVAGVLILLFPKEDMLHFPLILRPQYQGVHSGQMALPGGKVEPGDMDIMQTAIRETEEEIGVTVDRSQVLGKLTDLYIPPSNIIVTPVVAFSETEPVYMPDPAEVAGTVNISLEELFDIQNQMKTEVTIIGGKVMEVPAFQLQQKIVWGATAMILSELTQLIR